MLDMLATYRSKHGFALYDTKRILLKHEEKKTPIKMISRNELHRYTSYLFQTVIAFGYQQRNPMFRHVSYLSFISWFCLLHARDPMRLNEAL